MIIEQTTTIGEVLRSATAALAPTSATPRLDAELLLGHALGWSRARVLAEHGHVLEATQQAALHALVARRAALEPVAYIVGTKAFYGLDFIVTPAVLVPRPETELLVELALAWATDRRPTTDNQQADERPTTADRRPPTADQQVDERPTTNDQRPLIAAAVVVADIGTGSGAIAVALAAHLPRATVYATDISPQALQVAAQNSARHGLAGRVRLREGDLLAALPERVDLLVSNPPYTVLAEIDENVRRHEPHLALDGGADGLDVYRRLLTQAPGWLRPGGAVLLEIGATQGAAVAQLARAAFPTAAISVHQDLAGLDRVVMVSSNW